MTINLSEKKVFCFDFDGVVGRTMEDNYLSWKQAFQQFNIELPQRDYFALEGIKTYEMAKHFMQPKGYGDEDFKKTVANKETIYHQLNNFSYYPGILKLLEQLYLDKTLCLVTGANRDRLNNTSKFKEVLGFFKIIITADDVASGKPAKDPYEKCYRQLGCSPQECLAIENAPLGITSAKAAGLDCIAVCSTLSEDDLIKADLIFKNHELMYNYLLSESLK